MKVMIFLCAWKRPEITKVCYEGIHRIKKTFTKNNVDVDVFVTVSEDYHADLAEENGFKWIMSENKPVGLKHHNGLIKALEFEWDYIMQMGSDDVISNHYINVCCEHLGNHHIFGSDFYYFYDLNTKKEAGVQMKGGAPGGAGRFISRYAIETTLNKFGFFWQRHKNKRLDNSSWKTMCNAVRPNLNSYDEFCRCIEFEKPVLVDIKSDDSMNGWEIMESAGFKFYKDLKIPLKEYPELKKIIKKRGLSLFK